MLDRPKTFEEATAEIRHRRAGGDSSKAPHWYSPSSLAGPIVGSTVAVLTCLDCTSLGLGGAVTAVAAIAIGGTIGTLVTRILRVSDR